MNQNHSHITPEQYQKYLNGELSSEEAYEIEKILQSSSLYEESMEGFESLAADEILNDLNSLRDQIKIPVPQKEKRMPWLKIAAMLTLLIVGVPILWFIIDQQQPYMENLSDRQPEKSKAKTETLEKPEAISPLGNTADSAIENDEKQKTIALNDSNDENNKREDFVIPNPSEEKPKIVTPSPVSTNSSPVASPMKSIAMEVEDSEEVIEMESDAEGFVEAEDISIFKEAVIIEKDKKKSLRSAKEKKSAQRAIFSGDKNITDERGFSDTILSSGKSVELKSLLQDDSSLQKNKFDYSLSFPQPSTGMTAFEEYLKQNNILLHKKRRHNSITISFLVKSDSTLSDFKYIEGNSSHFDEIESILRKGPKWIPLENHSLNRVTQIFWKKSEKK